MAGKCKYCGFFGTQDEMVDHAGSCPVMLEDCQPDTMEETRHIHQQTNGTGAEATLPSFPFSPDGKGEYAGPFHGLGPKFD